MSTWKFSVRFNPFLDYKTRFSSRVSNIIQWLYHNARILKTRCVRWRFTRAWSSTACVTGALWAKRGERGILRETSAKRYFSPPLVLRKMPRSPSLGPGSALEEKRKKIDERGESFLAFFAHWGALSQASLAWLIWSHKAPVSYVSPLITSSTSWLVDGNYTATVGWGGAGGDRPIPPKTLN